MWGSEVQWVFLFGFFLGGQESSIMHIININYHQPTYSDDIPSQYSLYDYTQSVLFSCCPHVHPCLVLTIDGKYYMKNTFTFKNGLFQCVSMLYPLLSRSVHALLLGSVHILIKFEVSKAFKDCPPSLLLVALVQEKYVMQVFFCSCVIMLIIT